MKFSLPVALLAAAVSAQDPNCQADYIVETCLSTEQNKVNLCGVNDWSCLCAAYQAISTCYNNCPDDPRKSSADNQVIIYCQNASLYATTTAQSPSTQTGSGSSSDATPTEDAESDDASATTSSGSAASATSTPGAAPRLGGGIVLAVAGAVAAMI